MLVRSMAVLVLALIASQPVMAAFTFNLTVDAGGTVIGLAIGGLIDNGDVLAVITAFLAVLLGTAARYTLVRVLSSAPEIPLVVLANSLAISLIGGLAGHDLSVATGYASSPALIGLFSGLLAAILMDVLIIVYHARTAPNPSRDN